MPILTTTYRWMEQHFPNHIIIQKEGYFYSAHHNSAEALSAIMDYRLGRDINGYRITGGPDLNRICSVLENEDVSFLIVEHGRVTYGHHGRNPFKEILSL